MLVFFYFIFILENKNNRKSNTYVLCYFFCFCFIYELHATFNNNKPIKIKYQHCFIFMSQLNC